MARNNNCIPLRYLEKVQHLRTFYVPKANLLNKRIMTTRLIVTEVIGKSSAILHNDGLKLYSLIAASAKQGEVEISFEGIEFCTTSFLNASIGKYIQDKRSEEGLRYVHAPKHVLEKLQLVRENALNEKKRTMRDEATREVFYA